MIAAFALALHDAGLDVSAAETLDALRAAETLGAEEREIFKQGLRACLAKSASEARIFDECFERFFSPVSQERKDERRPERAASLQRDAASFALQRAASRIGLEGIQLFTQRGLYQRRLVEVAGMAEMERALLQARREGAAEEEGRLEEARQEMTRQARQMVERALLLHSRRRRQETEAAALMAASLSALDGRETAAMTRLASRLAKKLAAKYGRRRKEAQKGRPDMARIIRRNLAFDGQIHDLVWKNKRVSKPDLFLLCDVSGSVAAAARFLLMFLHALSSCVESCRAFAFSSHLGEVSALMEARDFSKTFREILRTHGGGSTDYGQAFGDFFRLAGDKITRRSVIIILGDARSNHGDPGADILREMSRRAARLLWINPEPKSLWGTGDSEMPRLAALCHAAHGCATIAQMERIVDGVLKLRL